MKKKDLQSVSFKSNGAYMQVNEFADAKHKVALNLLIGKYRLQICQDTQDINTYHILAYKPTKRGDQLMKFTIPEFDNGSLNLWAELDVK